MKYVMLVGFCFGELMYPSSHRFPSLSRKALCLNFLALKLGFCFLSVVSFYQTCFRL